MRKPNFGKPRSVSANMSSLSKKLPKLNSLRSATPSPARPHPKVGKPEIRRK